MKLSVLAGATSQSVNIFVQNSSSTTGAGLTGLVFNTSGLTAYYTFAGANATATAITLATLAAVNSAYSSGGFKEIDSTNMPGVYRLDLPNAVIASAKGRSVLVYLQGATNMAPCPLEVELTGWDNQDGVRGGLTALPNAAASAVGGLPVAVDTSGRVDVLKINGTSQTARDLGASVLLSSGTGTGQLDITSGVVKANLVQILATALTETAGLLAGGFKKFFNVASPSLTCLGVDQTGDSYARIGAAGASLSAVPDTSGTTTLLTRIPGTVAAQTGDSYARLGAPAGASHAADIAAVKTDTAAVKTQTDKLTFTVANQIDANVLDWKSSAAPAMTGDAFARLGAPAGASHAADVAAVKADTGGLRTDYTTTRAGYLDTLNGLVAAIWASATRTLTAMGFTDPNVALIKAKTDNLPASPAAVSDIPTATANADALLKRDLAAVSGEAARSPLNALRFLRNKWSVAGGTLTVTKEDDTTAAWTAAVTTDPTAEPVTGSDPA